MKLIYIFLLLFSFNSFASTKYNIKCFNDDIYTDLGTAKIDLKSTITVVEDNNYILEGGYLKFFIEDAWTDQNVEVTKTVNDKKYKPRVYKNHAKFKNFDKNFFGNVDFLVPHKSLLPNAKATFTGTFILSWVEDHWGGTVSADCTLTPIAKSALGYIPDSFDFNFKNAATGGFILNEDGSKNFNSFETIDDFYEVCYLGNAHSALLFLKNHIDSGSISTNDTVTLKLYDNIRVFYADVLTNEIHHCM